jgi:hypothetical protein
MGMGNTGIQAERVRNAPQKQGKRYLVSVISVKMKMGIEVILQKTSGTKIPTHCNTLLKPFYKDLCII